MHSGKKCQGAQGGFSLIELMIVIIIVAVLAGIALPAYQKQVLRGHRAAARVEMLDIANRQEQYLLSNRTYTNSASEISYSLPADVALRYSFSLSTYSASAAPQFLITFKPEGSQLADGSESLTLNNLGVRMPAAKWER